MEHQRISLRYSVPEDGPRIEQVDRLAHRLKLTLDEFISRAIVLYYDEVTQQMNDPAIAAQFAPDTNVGAAGGAADAENC